MKNYARENIYKLLAEGKKRQLTFNAGENLIEAMDKISKVFGQINNQPYPRNSLLEDAVISYINEIDSILREEYNISIFADSSEEKQLEKVAERQEKDFDTVVYPGYLEGFNETFLGEERWFYVRIQKEKIKKIKYIAIYLGSPISAITHYAEVADYIPSDKYPGKYIVLLKENTICRLPKKIPLGKCSPAATRAPKYTTLKRLNQAATYQNL